MASLVLRHGGDDTTWTTRKIMLDLREHGGSVWDRFTATKGDTLWYYRVLASAFRSRLPGHGLAEELERTMREMHELGGLAGGEG